MAQGNIPNPNDVREALVVELGNSNVMSITAGTARGYRQGSTMLCYVSIGVNTTQQRGANSGVFRVKTSDGHVIMPDVPYFILCIVNNDGVVRMCYRDDGNGFFTNPVAWEANKEIRITGAFTGTIL